MPIDIAKAKDLFLAVLEMPGRERLAYLDTACAGDTALRQRIEAMLRTHENSGELLPRAVEEMLAESGTTEADMTAAFPPAPHGATTAAEPAPSGAAELHFLAPPSKPGNLGRLAHYEIQEVIGKGGFGIVLKAFDEKLHRVVAIKVLSPAYAAIGSARQRFIREAQTAAAVKSEHVVAIHSVEDDAQPPYLVMEMIDGVSLQDKIDKKGALSIKEILRIGLQTAEGLAAAHKQGLVHRDIKPANILLENGVERVKITDFGLARAVDDASVSQSGTVAGTPMYMSPEQAEGVPVDHRSDLFSLGTVLYAMCTGHPPFRASGTHAVLKRVIDASPRPIREINDEIPDWLCDIIAKLHAKKPEDRFQTAREVAELLGQRLSDVQAGRVPIVDVPKAVLPAEPIRMRRPWIAALALVGMGAIFTYAAAMLFRLQDEQISPPGVQWLVAIVGLGMLVSGVFVAIKSLSRPGLTRATRGKIQEIGFFVALLAFAVGFNLAISYVWYGFALCIGSLLTLIFLFLSYDRENSDTAIEDSGAQPSSPSCALIRKRRRQRMGFGLALFVFIVSVIWAGPFALRYLGNRGEVEIIPEAGWVSVIVHKDGNAVTDWFGVRTHPTIQLPAGTYTFPAGFGPGRRLEHWEVTTHGLFFSQSLLQFNRDPVFEVARGERVTLRAIMRNEPPVAKTPNPRDEAGWVQLFNGKDLSGWKTLDPPEIWRVKDGNIVGGGGKGHLFTEREFENFHFRVEAKFVGKIDSGQFFRRKAGIGAYEAQIGGDTGTLLRTDPGKTILLFRNKDNSVPENTWFNQEVIADGNRLTVKLNGDVVVDTRDDKYRSGHLALQCYNAEGTVYFRKIEIKELPPMEPGWVQLFNGKDLSGWKKHPVESGDWKVENGLLIGSGRLGYLFSERGDYQNFHLRVEAKLNAGGDSGVFFRSRFQPLIDQPEVKSKSPAGYEVQINNDSLNTRTGSLFFVETGGESPSLTREDRVLTHPNQWCTLEVIADGPWLTVKVNGERTAYVKNTVYGRGHLALQIWPENTVIQFKKIEIKELPPTFKDDKERLQGQWVSVDFEEGGRNLKEGLNVAQWFFTFTGDRCQLKSVSAISGRTSLDEEGLFLADLGTNPKRFRLVIPRTEKDVRQLIGIYEFQGEYLRVCYAGHAGVPVNPDYPTAFATKAGSPLQLMTLKRSPASPAAPQFVISGAPRLLKTIDNKSTVRALAFTAEGDTLIAGGDHLTFFDRAKGDVLHQEKLPSEITCPFSLSKDRKTLALVYKDAALVLDLPIRKIPLQARRGLTFSAALSPDGKTLVYADEKMLRFHDRATGKTEEEARHGNLLGLKYSPDGRFLIGINAKELLILDAKTRDLVAKKAIGPGFGGGVEISQDSKRLVATGVSDGKKAFYVFSLPDHELQYTETNVAKPAFSLALSPDGNYLALGLMGGKVQIWDLAQKNAVASWTLAKFLPKAVAFSPDGKILATGSGNLIEIWDLTPQEPGWVPLFNGKDKSGWTTRPEQTDDWIVEDGNLVGRGRTTSFLFSQRGDFDNFHLRFEAKLKPKGNSGVFVRAPFALPFKTKWGPIPAGFQAHFQANENTVTAGGLQYAGPKPSLTIGSAPTDMWFAEEIIAQGERITLRVNGVTTTEFRDPERKYRKGHIALQALKDAGTVHFRKIEIKELTPQ